MNVFANSSVPTVGFFPNTFPRDPVKVDIFLEHVLLAQILEPLVESTSDGNISPAVAAKWTISADSRKIEFTLKQNIKFSNGIEVKADDVKYSIERHLNSHSQSSVFLQKIKAINIKTPEKLEIELFNPYVAVFKALSRDQLGIVPKNWKFDSKSKEPFIGTGPYRAIKSEKGWKLTLNPYYHDKETVQIPEWIPIFYDPKVPNYEEIEIPDLMPYLRPEAMRALEKRSDNPLHVRTRINHFTQLSAWWFEDGSNVSNKDFKIKTMTAIRALLDVRREKLGFRKATGVIPEGILGYLPESPGPIPANVFLNTPLISVKVAIQGTDMGMIKDPIDVSEIEKKYRVKFDFVSYAISEWDRLKDIKPDVVLYSFAGGFYDPEGFLVVLSPDLAAFFGSDYEKYVKASSETNWGKRAGLYQELGSALVQNYVMVPAWKLEIVSLNQPNLVRNESLSYTPKLKEYRYK